MPEAHMEPLRFNTGPAFPMLARHRASVGQCLVFSHSDSRTTCSFYCVTVSMNGNSDINPLIAVLSYLNFDPLEVASRYREPQLQVGENYSYSFNLRPNI